MSELPIFAQKFQAEFGGTWEVAPDGESLIGRFETTEQARESRAYFGRWIREESRVGMKRVDAGKVAFTEDEALILTCDFDKLLAMTHRATFAILRDGNAANPYSPARPGPGRR